MLFVPALSAEALLAGLQACGVDAARIRATAGLAPRYSDPSQMLPGSVWTDIWAAAERLDPRADLAALAATRIPFGLFGTLDYLAGSAQTVRGGLQALSDHFAAAASGIELELNFDAPDAATLRIINSDGVASVLQSDEFTVAVILGRFRSTSSGRFLPRRVYLTRAPLADDAHAVLFGAPVVYGAPRAGFDCDRAAVDLEQSMADTRLHDTLLEIARKLGFSNDGKSGIEVSVRARLRSLLPRGQAVAERVARSLGISERTLHRRLSESGSSFQDVLDQFRIEESERHLLQGGRDLSAIALELGFSDQSAWNRYFKRLRHMSPTAWQSAHRPPGEAR